MSDDFIAGWTCALSVLEEELEKAEMPELLSDPNVILLMSTRKAISAVVIEERARFARLVASKKNNPRPPM